MATVTFIGAAQQVTGSCYLVESRSAGRFLFDCGIHQGAEDIEDSPDVRFPFDPASLDAVILSHAHLDHSGNLPRLVQQGFRNPIYCTPATARMLKVMWADALGLYEKDLEYENLRRARRGAEPLQAAYDEADVEKALKLCKPVAFRECLRINASTTVCLHDSGHILGSAIVELKITEDGKEKTLVFSGDLGKRNGPLMNDPALLTHADAVMMESTYGNRDHKPMDATLKQFEQVLHETWERKGNVMIPAFAIGRSQDLLYHLGVLQTEGKLDPWQIFLDSPMGIAITTIYDECYELLDKQDLVKIKGGFCESIKCFLPQLHFTKDQASSMAINKIKQGALIIAGSGMCTGGRIKHHFKHRIWNERNTVIFCGYQARGTLGRRIVDGEKLIRMFGSEFAVRARIETLGGFSAHAGQSDLLNWVGSFQPKPHVLLVHGEPETQKVLQEKLRNDQQLHADIPHQGEVVQF
ncbi:MAG: MBL fold metallo-hydrolase [Pseudomonadota bacterium]